MNRILITGGIGDFIALEAHMLSRPEEVWLATRAHEQIKELIKALGWQCAVHVVGDQKRMQNEPYHYLREVPGVPSHVQDWGIAVRFPLIKSGILKFKGSGFMKLQPAEDGAPVLIQPGTSHDKRHPRFLTETEWSHILDHLDRTNQTAVVIGDGQVPHENKRLRKLDTDIVTVCRYVLAAKTYMGVDSWASVLAAKDKDKQLFVKSNNPHCYNHKHIYYAPWRDMVMTEAL